MKRTVPKAAALFLVAVLTYVTKAEADNPHFTTIDLLMALTRRGKL